MKSERIGWGAKRLEAMKAGHWFARYAVELFGRTLYLSRNGYAQLMPIIESYRRELGSMNSATAQLRRAYEECDVERERAIDGWHDETRKRETVEGHNRILRTDNFTFMAERDAVKQELARAKSLREDAEREEHAGKKSELPFNLSQEEPRYVGRFLEACRPKQRTAPAVIYSNGHQTDHHSRPRGFDRFVKRLNSSDYVVGIHVHTNPPAQTKRRQMKVHADGERFYISVPYFDGNSFGATIRADITAEDPLEAGYTLYSIMELMG